jgi:DNA-directed RNA polymerase subunit RPC12/RpoP
MNCEKNDVSIFIPDDDGGAVYHADRFACESCGSKVFFRFSPPCVKGSKYFEKEKTTALKIDFPRP